MHIMHLKGEMAMRNMTMKNVDRDEGNNKQDGLQSANILA